MHADVTSTDAKSGKSGVMQAYVMPADSKSVDDLKVVERPAPKPGPGQVVVRVRAVSLNYRDQMAVVGRYFQKNDHETVPCSDGAGEVIAVGEGVRSLKVGDPVAGTFSQPDPAGPANGPPFPMGIPLDGMLAQQVLMHEVGAVKLPQGYSFEEGACLPCAGVTAWNCLFGVGRPVKPGDTVLVLGSGGVSIWGLQLARAAGCRVIATTSRDGKAQRLRALGASDVINYKTHEDWDQEVLKVTGGRGADCIVEVGGPGTLQRSFNSIARGGKVGLIGVLTQGASNPQTLMMRGGSLHGIFVGDRNLFEQLVAAIDANAIKPVIDKVFPFDQAKDAFRHQQSGDFIGKIVIQV
jgi:NADPH:quinone reductase-like Zn-dependent oxidoreductase